jgi:hypothetical protein
MDDRADTARREQGFNIRGASVARVNSEKNSAAALDLRTPLFRVRVGHASLRQRRLEVARHLTGHVSRDFAELGCQRSGRNHCAGARQAYRDRRKNIAAQLS